MYGLDRLEIQLLWRWGKRLLYIHNVPWCLTLSIPLSCLDPQLQHRATVTLQEESKVLTSHLGHRVYKKSVPPSLGIAEPQANQAYKPISTLSTSVSSCSTRILTRRLRDCPSVAQSPITARTLSFEPARDKCKHGNRRPMTSLSKSRAKPMSYCTPDDLHRVTYYLGSSMLDVSQALCDLAGRT